MEPEWLAYLREHAPHLVDEAKRATVLQESEEIKRLEADCTGWREQHDKMRIVLTEMLAWAVSAWAFQWDDARRGMVNRMRAALGIRDPISGAEFMTELQRWISLCKAETEKGYPLSVAAVFVREDFRDDVLPGAPLVPNKEVTALFGIPLRELRDDDDPEQLGARAILEFDNRVRTYYCDNGAIVTRQPLPKHII